MPSPKEILALYAEGLSTREIATRYQFIESWGPRSKQQFRETGKTAHCTALKREPKWAPLIFFRTIKPRRRTVSL